MGAPRAELVDSYERVILNFSSFEIDNVVVVVFSHRDVDLLSTLGYNYAAVVYENH